MPTHPDQVCGLRRGAFSGNRILIARKPPAYYQLSTLLSWTERVAAGPWMLLSCIPPNQMRSVDLVQSVIPPDLAGSSKDL